TDVNFNSNDIVSDPGLRKPIEDFDVAFRDQVRREYLTRGPCQPIGNNYPQKEYGKQRRSFQNAWFKQHPWLEYSVTKDAAFCFWCYLFTPSRENRIKEDAFTKIGFNNWKKALEKFVEHVDAVNSVHNDARIQFQSFQNQRRSMSHQLVAHSHEMEVEYCTRLTTILDVSRFLLKQGLAFRGHDESSSLLNKGNFLELLEWYSLWNDQVFRAVNQNAPGNNQMTSPMIQKELANACAAEITCAIVDDIRDKYFSLMIDEARDVSVKEQMGVVLRYVNKNGYVIEWFLAMVHVSDTSAISLKNAIAYLFAKHGVLKENPYARYIHCFVHQLQLVIVAVAKDNRIVSDFFQYVTMIVNAEGASCKRGITASLIEKMKNYQFVFVMYLMRRLLGIINKLSLALQQKDQNIVQAMHLIEAVKARLQDLRETGWEAFLEEVSSFCEGNSITVPNLGDNIITLLLSCLDPRDSFSKFDIHKLLRLAKLYLKDFTMTKRMMLEDQLTTFIYDVRHDADFINVGDLGGFARKMLALALLVVTANVERVFSAMNIVKTDLRNKMGDEWMNDSLVVYIEREVFATIGNEAILQRFQKMQTRWMQLSLSFSQMPHISSTNIGIGSSSSVHK
ncbi:Ribonuclease H-like protein, partial [Dioscorea alata]